MYVVDSHIAICFMHLSLVLFHIISGNSWSGKEMFTRWHFPCSPWWLNQGPDQKQYPSSSSSCDCLEGVNKDVLWHVMLGHDSVSVEPIIWVRQGDESESGKMVLEKVKWTHFDAYLWKTMWNRGINGRVQTFRFSVFTMGRQELCAENT